MRDSITGDLKECILTTKSPFKIKVIEVVKMIPHGKVVSYGQVALLVGIPRAAIQVGWVLNKYSGPEKLPWWRVINNAGRISIKGDPYTPMDQKLKLEEEGIKVNEDFSLDINLYRWRPEMSYIRSLQLEPKYIDELVSKYNL